MRYQEPDLETLGGRLRYLRKTRWEQYKSHISEDVNPYEDFEFCSSQDSFAEHFGIKKITISRWENNHTKPSVELASEICAGLGYPLYFLLEKVGNIDDIYKAKKTYPQMMSSVGIHEEIVFKASKDEIYLEYLNFFMDPKRTRSMINHINSIQFSTWLANREVTGINGTLLNIVEDAFHKAQMYAHYENEPFQKIQFIAELKLALPEDGITFAFKNKEPRFQVLRCIDKDYRKIINTKSYEMFIFSLADCYFTPLRNKMLYESQKMIIVQEFMDTYDEYVEHMLSEFF